MLGKQRILTIICLSVVTIAMYTCMVKIYYTEKYNKIIEEIKMTVSTQVPEKVATADGINSVAVEFDSKVYSSENLDPYTCKKVNSHTLEKCFNIVVNVDDSLDDWSVSRQYQYIDTIGNMIINEYTGQELSKMINPICPNYDRLYDYLEKIYGNNIFEETDWNIVLKTSQNTYEYVASLDNYFRKNNDGVFVYDEDGQWSGFSSGFSDVTSYDGKCILSHCDSNVREGSPYCYTHACTTEGCRNQKDPMVTACDKHNCKAPNCARPIYKAVSTKYCNFHYREYP